VFVGIADGIDLQPQDEVASIELFLIRLQFTQLGGDAPQSVAGQSSRWDD
jgi:hypothetical protein